MNKDTLWLQVPAAKVPPQKLFALSSVPDKPEHIANKLMRLQGNEYPYLDKINIVFFAADHGVAVENKPALVQPITAEILNKYSSSSEAHRVLAEKLKTKLEVINLGTKNNLKSVAGIINSQIDSNTNNFCHIPAMNHEQLAKAINVGRQTAQRIKLNDSQLFVASEINNASILSASAITCSLLNISPEQLTELNSEQKKLIQQAFACHEEKLTSPLEILRHLGSFEIAALTGSYLCCAHMGMPVLIDGFASAVAALITARLCPDAEQWFIYSHAANDTAHKRILQALSAQPLLNSDQNLSDIAGIAISLSLLHLACANHNENIIFENENLTKQAMLN